MAEQQLGGSGSGADLVGAGGSSGSGSGSNNNNVAAANTSGGGESTLRKWSQWAQGMFKVRECGGGRRATHVCGF